MLRTERMRSWSSMEVDLEDAKRRRRPGRGLDFDILVFGGDCIGIWLLCILRR